MSEQPNWPGRWACSHPGWLGLAAAGLAADMVSATIINAAVLHSSNVVLTAVLCAVSVLLAYGRRQQIKGLWAAIRR